MALTAADALSLRRYGPSHGSHSHGHFQVLLGLQGTLDLEIEGRGQRIAHGGGCVIAPGERHDFESTHGSLCLVLDSDEPGWAHCVQRAAPLPAHAHPLVQYLSHALQAGHALAQAQGPALLLEAWRAAASTGAAHPGTHAAAPQPAPRRVIEWERLQQWAAQEWHRDLTVAELAQQVHLSASQFSARCRDELGLGPMEWLRSQRLTHARLLRGSGMPVAEVARFTGYRSPSALTAALRRTAPTLTPLQTRNQT